MIQVELIDRYIYAVTQRLPEDSRNDVKQELYGNIQDMLPDNPTDNDVRLVLEQLGNPARLADEYCQTKRYLIGPGLYDTYITILKLVITILTLVCGFSAVLERVIVHPADTGLIGLTAGIIIRMLVAAVQGAVSGFIWVTVIFAILERTGIDTNELTLQKKKWSPDDLPTIPISTKSMISRVEVIFSMFFTVFATALIYFKPELIAIYTKSDRGLTLVASLFIKSQLRHYMPAIFLVSTIGLAVLAWKFIAKRWSISLAVANTVRNMLSAALVYIMINDNSLFNQRVFTEAANIITVSHQSVTHFWSWLTMTFIAVFIVASIWDSVDGFLKCRKSLYK
jgi:hypothetical protein